MYILKHYISTIINKNNITNIISKIKTLIDDYIKKHVKARTLQITQKWSTLEYYYYCRMHTSTIFY